jgi:hypothetical protein
VHGRVRYTGSGLGRNWLIAPSAPTTIRKQRDSLR